MSLLEAKGIVKRFGPFCALDGIDLHIAAGQFHGLIGPNGSGKSTLLKCLAGAEQPTAGNISFVGRSVTRVAASERSRLGLSLKFQITSILPKLSVHDNLLLAIQAHETLPRLLASRSRRRAAPAVAALLERFKLAQFAREQAGNLSHGHQQWLEIAMALARKPKLLILDEPTGGMSVEERRATADLLEPLRQDCALLIVEHDLDFIRGLCDVITVLDQGKVVASGPVAQVQSDPKVREVYLGRV